MRTNEVLFSAGTHQECQYALMTFGIPVQSLPVGFAGGLKTTNHLKWIARRKAKDTSIIYKKGVFCGIDFPRKNDVVLGRGRNLQEHPGCVQLRNIVSGLLEDYKPASIQDKKGICLKIIDLIKELGGSFLKQNRDGWWVPVSDEVARDKVGMTFRTALSIQNAKRKAEPGTEGGAIDTRKRSKPEPCADMLFGLNPFGSKEGSQKHITS